MQSPERRNIEESAARLFAAEDGRAYGSRRGPRLVALFALIVAALPIGVSAQVAVDDSFTVAPGSTNNQLDVLANDVISPGFSFIVSVTPPNQGGEATVTGNRRAVVYTPPAGFVGTETFRYTLWNGGFWSAQVTVQVIGRNSRPRAVDDRYETRMSTRLDVGAGAGVLANDTDSDGDPLSATLRDNVRDGTLTLRPDGSFTYVPRTGFTGDDRFEYEVADGRGGTDRARVTIAVGDGGEAPVVSPIPNQTGYIGTPFELDLAAYVTDADTPAESLRYAALSAFPPNLTISALGRIEGTLAGGTAGTYTIRFSVSDGSSTTTGSFVLVVENEPAVDLVVALTVEPNPVTVGAQSTWLVSISNTSGFSAGTVDVDGRFGGSTSIELDAATVPAGCTITPEPPDVVVSCIVDVLAAGASASIELTGSGSASGDVLATFTAESQTRDDSDPSDNTNATSLSIADSISRESAQAIVGYAIGALDAGDLDGDGFADLAAVSDDGVLVFLSMPDPANPLKTILDDAPIVIGSAAAGDAIALADVDGDGDLDIVVAGPTSEPARVHLNGGSGSFAVSEIFAPAVGVRAIAAADVDGDGFVDLILAGSNGSLLSRGTGVPGEFGGPIAFGAGSAVDVAVADLFGDSLPEIVLANDDGDAVVFVYDGAGVVSAATVPSGPTTSVTASDFSGDGAIDLLFGRDRASGTTTTPANPLFVNRSAADPAFSEAGGLGAAPTFSVLASDTDDDTLTDAIVLNRSGGHQVFKNTGGGDGSFQLAPEQIAAANSRVGTHGRFSVDDRADLAVAGPDGIAIYFADGFGSFGLGDVTPPALTLVGDARISLTVGAPWTDPGATATDAADGDLSALVAVSGDVDTALLGSYVVTYEVADTSGNGATATRTVEVTPREAVGGGGGGALGITFVLLLLTLSLIARSRSEDEDG